MTKQPTQTFSEQLEAILEDYGSEEPTTYQFNNQALEAITDAVRTLCLEELIGEDDDTSVTDNHKSPSKYRKGMNYLRAEQRAKLAELLQPPISEVQG